MDRLAKFVNPRNVKPEDLVATAGYVIVSRPVVRSVPNGSGSDAQIEVVQAVSAKNRLWHVFSRVLSVGGDVTLRTATGRPVGPGTFVVTGNALPFTAPGQEAFADCKISHQSNVIVAIRDIASDEKTDNILLQETPMIAKREDHLAKFTNPESFLPRDLVAVGQFIVVERPIVREIGDGDRRIELARAEKQKNEIRQIFCRVISVGPDVTSKTSSGKKIATGDYVVYGDSLGFFGAGQEVFEDYKIVHNANILTAVRDVPGDEMTDNVLLRDRLEEEKKGRDTEKAPPVRDCDAEE